VSVRTVDRLLVVAVIALSGLLAAFADVHPTDHGATNVVLASTVAVLVTWLGASTPWWGSTVAALLAVAGALGGPLLLTLAAVVAAGAAVWIGVERFARPVASAAIAAVVVQVALRLTWNPWFLAPSLLAAAAIGFIVVPAFLARGDGRRWAAGIAALAVLAGVLAAAFTGTAAYWAGAPARDGYDEMLDALDQLGDGNLQLASRTFATAADKFDEAYEELDGGMARPGRYVPGVSQNLAVGADVVARAADATEAAAAALAAVDVNALTIDDGRIDLAALRALEDPFRALDASVLDLREVLREAGESPWLLAPVRSRLDEADDVLAEAAHRTRALALAASVGPAVFGADGPRRYLVGFADDAETRAHGGVIEHWVELTITDGVIAVTASGTTADLRTAALDDLELDASDEYLARYGPLGAQTATGGVSPRFWRQVTASPDMPSVGNALSQMYERVTGRAVDGVLLIDTRGLARLLAVAGPVEIADLGLELDEQTIARFVRADQYALDGRQRATAVQAVVGLSMANLLSGALPRSPRLIGDLAPAALNGHLSAWSTRPAEQELFHEAGMDGALPVPTADGVDSLAIVSRNLAGNKIDPFLARSIDYRPEVDEATGGVQATLEVTLTNLAPAKDLPDAIIANSAGLPPGTNATMLEVYTPLDIVAASVDGEAVTTTLASELSYNVHGRRIEVPPGGTVVVELELQGNIGPGDYALVYRPQPMPRVDRLTVEATTPDGAEVLTFEGRPARRTVITADGTEAWR